MADGPLRLAVIGGDGIGPEVVEQALLTLDRLGLGIEFAHLDHVGAARFLADGVGLDDADLELIRGCDAVLLGAVGDPRVTDPAYGRGVLLRLRFELDLYVNYRPTRLSHDRLSPLRDPGRRAIDCAIVRENTEGLYVGAGGTAHPGTDAEVAIDTSVHTHRAVARIIDFAMSVATRSVCMVDKANAVPNAGRLWQRCWAAAPRRAGLSFSHLYVDAAAMALIQDPTRFDVIVTENSYGDILSDVAAALAGGSGVAASVNLNPDTGFGLYEPTHGSAPGIAGTGTANPIGAIASAALLLDRSGLPEPAAAIRAAIDAVVAAGRCTPDLGGRSTTAEVGASIRALL